VRAFIVFGRLAPFVLAFLRDRRRFVIVGRPRHLDEPAHRRRAQRLTATLAGLGPAFIKLAQLFASRADILPEPYLSEFGQLTDRVPPLPSQVIEGVIERELGRPPSQVFDRFDAEPLAAASLGQVHRAKLGDREVVVKVLRPGVEEVVATDLQVAFRIMFVMNVLFPGHHVRSITTILREFSKRIDEEMDFRQEANNASRLRANFAADSRVAVPSVAEEFTRQRVLVLEFMEGTRVDRLQERIANGDVSIERLLDTLVAVYIKMMLVDGLFHADPHPGNLLVSPQGQLVLLDFGMVIPVDRDTRSRLIRTVTAAARQDVDGIVAGFYELGLIDPEVDRGTVRDAARALMAIAYSSDAKPKQIQRIISEVMSTFYRWPITLPSELVYFGRAAALAEGIGVRYVPSFNSIEFVTPIVARMRGELVTSMFGEGRDVVQGLVDEIAGIARELRDVLRRAGRDELRLRAHPRDIIEMQLFLARQTRRVLLCIFAAVIAIIGTMLYIAQRNVALLAVTLAASLLFFLIVLLLPQHLLSNPFRGWRAWR